jgi:AcrR family transcriptional regulator
MRSLMIATAARIVQGGAIPTVSEVAEAASVSRATAYRYFPNYASMLKAVVDEALGPILDWESTAKDPKVRVSELLEFSYVRMHAFEATHRAALLLALDQWVRRRNGTLGAEPPIVRGNRKMLLRKAIDPLSGQISKKNFDRLTHALSLTFGIEALIVLSDIWGLNKEEAEEVAVWTSQALVQAALRDNEKGRKAATKSAKHPKLK